MELKEVELLIDFLDDGNIFVDIVGWDDAIVSHFVKEVLALILDGIDCSVDRLVKQFEVSLAEGIQGLVAFKSHQILVDDVSELFYFGALIFCIREILICLIVSAIDFSVHRVNCYDPIYEGVDEFALRCEILEALPDIRSIKWLLVPSRSALIERFDVSQQLWELWWPPNRNRSHRH